MVTKLLVIFTKLYSLCTIDIRLFINPTKINQKIVTEINQNFTMNFTFFKRYYYNNIKTLKVLKNYISANNSSQKPKATITF